MTGCPHQAQLTAFEPADFYAELRAHGAVYEVDHEPPFYVLSHFGDVQGALKDPGRWTSRDGPGVFFQPGGVLAGADDPDHARHRRILREAFLPSAITRIEPELRAIATSLLDGFVDRGEGDFVDLFAFPFPALVIGELLGIPPEDRDRFRRWSEDIVAALTGGDLDVYRTATIAVGDYLDARVAEREATWDPADPPADVLSRLLAAREAGEITPGELRHIGHQLLVAGHETTTSLLGLMLYRLLERPDLMARLRADRHLLPTAIEEALRFDSPVHGLFRTNAQACAMGGGEIPERSKVQLLFGCANRDPERFEASDDFRIDRAPEELRGHVAFGWGVHYCLGAALARAETRIAFELIFDRMADIELAGTPRRSESYVLHGLKELPIRWRPVDAG